MVLLRFLPRSCPRNMAMDSIFSSRHTGSVPADLPALVLCWNDMQPGIDKIVEQFFSGTRDGIAHASALYSAFYKDTLFQQQGGRHFFGRGSETTRSHQRIACYVSKWPALRIGGHKPTRRYFVTTRVEPNGLRIHRQSCQ